MPVSHHRHIPTVLNAVDAVDKNQPMSILDIGAGFGKYGLLLRERLDVRRKRVNKRDWAITIDAVEYYAPYINPVFNYIYNNVLVGDISDLVKNLKSYDIILILECLEHLEKDDGKILIKQLWNLTNTLLIVSFPTYFNGGEGSDWPNPREEHRCLWTKSELDSIIGTTKQLSPTIFTRTR